MLKHLNRWAWSVGLGCLLVIIVALVVFTYLINGCVREAKEIAQSQPADPPVRQVLTGQVTLKSPESNEQRGRRLFISHVRHRVTKELRTRGFDLIGHDKTPLKDEQIAKLHAAIDDDTIMRGAHETGALGDGTILGRLGDLWKWVQDHQEQILALLKFVLSLMALAGL